MKLAENAADLDLGRTTSTGPTGLRYNVLILFKIL